MNLFTANHWKDYELLDCGDLEKLERFGNIVLRRPEPQALWKKQFTEQEWNKLADVKFIQKGSHAGEWKKNSNVNDKWKISYNHDNLAIKFNLSLTSFKHVGIFPEQALNWDYIFNSVKTLDVEQPKVLNLFAYTGGASLAAKAAGADVTHVDSIKQVINWSRENMESSNLNDIRWVVEDALKFVKREVKRGKKYNGVILDPPAYGIGANGERWKLEDSINEILSDISHLLDEKHFLILNVYSLGLSPLILENLIATNFVEPKNLELGEVYLNAQSGIKLPLGILARFNNIL
ncbi:MAG: class I SAM-dependent methyltransferase [Bacteroidia bacterium]|nr:class I SAM-dependent methyltransferase [Bacteroidia bacterium]MBP9689274.1 class I SAM-dependent methyltransferase [Bacteroidia bacterium]